MLNNDYTLVTTDLNNDVSGVIQSTCIVMNFVKNQFVACNLKLDMSIDSTTWLKLFAEQGTLLVYFQKIFLRVKEQPKNQ